MTIMGTYCMTNLLKKFMTSNNLMFAIPRRYRYKKKWSMNLKDIPNCKQALSNFDAFYKPYFGDQWTSIRVSLLSLPKYCAAINKYGNADKIASQLGDLDLINFVDHVRTMQNNEIHERIYASSGSLEMSQSLHENSSSESKTTETVSELSPGINDSSEFSSITSTSNMVDQHNEDMFEDDNLNMFVPTEQVYSEKDQLLREEISINSFQPRGASIELLPVESLRISKDVNAFVFARGDVSMFPQSKAHDRIFGYYLMDAASVMPVIALDVHPTDNVLDLCAAPGGKTYNILQSLDLYAGGTLCCNDSSQLRLSRLRNILYSYFPADVAAQVTITKTDGIMPPPTKYNKVLVDAPCNSDRHVVTEDDNNLFKLSRTRERLSLMENQKNLLISGIKACVPGGTIVYSTCTLSPAQNDGVIQAVLEELGHNSLIEVAVHDLSPLADMFGHVFQFCGKSRYGQLIVPTLMNNFGPSYFAKLRRVK